MPGAEDEARERLAVHVLEQSERHLLASADEARPAAPALHARGNPAVCAEACNPKRAERR